MTRDSKSRRRVDFRIPEEILLQLRDINDSDPKRGGISAHVVEALTAYCSQKASKTTADRVATLTRRKARLDYLFHILSDWFKGTREMYARSKFDAWVTKNLGVRNLADCSDEAWQEFQAKTDRVGIGDEDRMFCQRLAWEIEAAAIEAQSREMLIKSTKDQIAAGSPEAAEEIPPVRLPPAAPELQEPPAEPRKPPKITLPPPRITLPPPKPVEAPSVKSEAQKEEPEPVRSPIQLPKW